jgi:hypothetical protein
MWISFLRALTILQFTAVCLQADEHAGWNQYGMECQEHRVLNNKAQPRAQEDQIVHLHFFFGDIIFSPAT